MARVPRMATGTTGHTGLGGDDERAHVERPQPRGASQAALGEDHQRLPGSDEADEPVGVGHAVLALVALDELGAEPLEHEPDEPFALYTSPATKRNESGSTVASTSPSSQLGWLATTMAGPSGRRSRP